MIFERIPVGVYAANCYIIGCRDTLQGVIVDPGGDAQDILEAVERHALVVKYIIMTHGHFDHTGALVEVKRKTAAHVAIHKDDKDMLTDSKTSLAAVVGGGSEGAAPDLILEDGDRLEVGGLVLNIIHTPGHTPGGICIDVDGSLVISGDTLFKGSIGRTDLPGGDYDKLIGSIKSRLMVLDGQVKVYPGHGPATTIEREKSSNPFL